MADNEPKLTYVEQQVQNLQERAEDCRTCMRLIEFRSGEGYCEVGIDAGRVMDGLMQCRKHCGKN